MGYNWPPSTQEQEYDLLWNSEERGTRNPPMTESRMAWLVRKGKHRYQQFALRVMQAAGLPSYEDVYREGFWSGTTASEPVHAADVETAWRFSGTRQLLVAVVEPFRGAAVEPFQGDKDPTSVRLLDELPATAPVEQRAVVAAQGLVHSHADCYKLLRECDAEIARLKQADRDWADLVRKTSDKADHYRDAEVVSRCEVSRLTTLLVDHDICPDCGEDPACNSCGARYDAEHGDWLCYQCDTDGVCGDYDEDQDCCIKEGSQ